MLGKAAVAKDSAATIQRGYGPLVDDPAKLLDLPQGFAYKIISRTGDRLDDGLLTPSCPDGMAAFSGPDGLTLLVRNHEVRPNDPYGPFGKQDELLSQIDPTLLYDRGAGQVAHKGGTTTIVYDCKKQETVRQFLSLGGTTRNCAGGPTPWGSWITCEETVARAGHSDDDGNRYQSDFDHGYCFDVPVSAEMKLHAATPIKAMGRFRHEAVAVSSDARIVYLTEDREDGLLYRFLADEPGKLLAGGRLQVLQFREAKSVDTRRWQGDPVVAQTPLTVEIGSRHPVEWFDVDGADVESPHDDLRFRYFKTGAARFARGEGIWHAGDGVYIACTDGGLTKKGQIWRYLPSPAEGLPGEQDQPGMLELFLEPNDSRLLEAADNLVAAPWGDIVVCEDRQGAVVRLLGVTTAGELYTLARNHSKCEFAGAAFSPDGSTLFVNIQAAGLTLAITGPWRGKG